MPNNINISPIISPDVLKTISDSTAIKTFGSQLKDKAKEKTTVYFKNKAGELTDEINLKVQEEINLGTEHSKKIQRIQTLFVNKQITEQEYNNFINAELVAFEAQKANISLEIQKLKTDIQNILLDPYKRLKDEQKKTKDRLKILRKRTQDKENKSKRDLTKQVLVNLLKSLAPVITLQLANNLILSISQRKKLEELVDSINNYIDTQVKDQQTVEIATNLRNSAIALINNSIKKLNKIQTIIKTINRILIILNIAISIILLVFSIPKPLGLGPSMPTLIAQKLNKLERLVSALNAVLAIITVLLSNEIIALNELKERLKQISLKLDNKTLNNLNQQELTQLTETFTTNISQINLPTFPPYKGFKFKIKEEQNPAFVVKGNKRHYAVAIDNDGVEVIKSEYSFTLDPNDLIEQLKLIIDQRNLQA